MLVQAREESSTSRSTYRFGLQFLLLCGAALMLVLIAFRDGLAPMVDTWWANEEYSHGFLMPLIAAFLVWQRKEVLRRSVDTGSWLGVLLILAGGSLGIMGRAAAVFVLQQYAMLLVIAGLILSFGGKRLLRQLAAPLVVLLLMVPLPSFLISNLSAQLQLISSQIGVWVVRSFGISVYLEGNVIDLGSYQLQVAEACSGLRYLFPLMTIGFVMAYFFKTAMWKRVLVFASSMPITIAMNSVRIGLIGVTVEYFGPGAAEGVLHDFEGWVVFMASAGLLVIEMMLLSRIGADRRHWREQFGLEFPETSAERVEQTAQPVPKPFVAALASVTAIIVFAAMPAKAELTPPRESLTSFPQDVRDWTGRRGVLDAVYVDALKFDDYLLSDYGRTGRQPINVYIAWYDSQRAGQSAHSPRTCLPGGGWRIVDLKRHQVSDITVGGRPLAVNRAVIANGQQRQLVYYWFQQRGRAITNEYLVKWYLFWDSLTRNRTDGALVRLIVPVTSAVSLDAAENGLREFLTAASPELPRFVPN